MSVLFPSDASWHERFTARSVFPTPPFWLATARIRVVACLLASVVLDPEPEALLAVPIFLVSSHQRGFTIITPR